MQVFSLHQSDVEHYYIVAKASAHYKQVKDLVGAKEFVSCVKERELQSVDNSADGIDNAACDQPGKSGRGKRLYQRNQRAYTKPSHGDVNQGGEPFGTGDPKCFDQHADQSDTPHKDQKRDSDAVSERNQADRRIASRDQDEDHHVIDLPKYLVYFF